VVVASNEQCSKDQRAERAPDLEAQHRPQNEYASNGLGLGIAVANADPPPRERADSMHELLARFACNANYNEYVLVHAWYISLEAMREWHVTKVVFVR
jgi:hypothetical protein